MTPRQLDDRVLHDVNTFARHTGWLHAPALNYATYGVVLFAGLLIAGLLLARTRRARTLAAAGWACLAAVVAVAVNQPVGHLFHEARPYATHRHLLVLASRTSDFSFPSDHAVMAGAAAAGLFLVSRRLGVIAAAAAVLMALARVYISAHYPWDVLGGLVFGAAVTGLGWLILRIPLTALVAQSRRLPGLRAVLDATPKSDSSTTPVRL